MYYLKLTVLKLRFRFWDLLWIKSFALNDWANDKFWDAASALRDTRDMHNYLKGE